MTRDQTYYDDLERLLRESLKRVEADISERDRDDVAEYLDFGEYGVAYELLTDVLDKERVAHPEQLREAGQKMGMNE